MAWAASALVLGTTLTCPARREGWDGTAGMLR